MDFIEACLEEIALEGLDGITFQALWLRLEHRRTKFPLRIDEKSKAYIWRGIATCSDVDFHELPNPRPPLRLWKREDYYDDESGMHYEPEDDELLDIYPIKIISEDGITGSCETFHSRKNVTNLVRDSSGNALMPYGDIMKKWGSQFVMVASQATRTKYILGVDTNPCIINLFNSLQYCILERVGRARYEGAVAVGKDSLNVFNESSNKMFYHRKLMLEHNLITKQYFTMRKPIAVSAPTHVNLMHLHRFFVEYKSKVTMSVERIIDLLMQAPNRMVIFQDLKEELSTTKKIFKLATSQANFKKEQMPISSIYPDISNEEKYTKNGGERSVKVLKMVKRFKLEEDDIPEEEGDCQDVETVDIVRDEPILNQAYRFVERLGPQGCEIEQLAKAFGVGPLDARLMMSNLLSRGVVSRFLAERGRQRIQRFVAFVHEKDCNYHKDIEKHKTTVQKMIKSVKDEEETINDEDLTVTDVDVIPTGAGGDVVLDVTAKTEYSITEGCERTMLDYMEKKQTSLRQPSGKGVVTSRKIHRMKLFLDTVEEQGVTDKIHLQKIIYESELKDGSTSRMCRKTLTRMVKNLAAEGQIKVIKTLVTVGNKEQKMEFVCLKSVSPNDQRITDAIHRAKKKLLQQRDSIKAEVKRESGDEACTNVDDSLPSGSKKAQPKIKMIYKQDASRAYGLVPRMRRQEILHKYLFYLTRSYNGTIPGGFTAYEAFMDQTQREHKVEPEVYCSELDWRRFLPPIPVHHGYGKGWFYLSDALTVLPLQLLCQLVNFPYIIEELKEYLADPIKRYYPMCCLPPTLFAQLTYKRKYVFVIFDELIKRLCYQGLLTIGPQNVYAKEKCFAYIHFNATLYDTLSSEPGYMCVSDKEYPEKVYQFRTNSDIAAYWADLEYIAVNTSLVRSSRGAEEQFNYRTLHLTKRLQDSLVRKKPNEIVDNGFLPGDRRGAAGLDTIFFNHRAQNWSWPYLKIPFPRKVPGVKTSVLVKKLREKSKAIQISKKTVSDADKDGGQMSVIQTKLTKEKAASRRGGKGIKRKAKTAPGEEVPRKVRRQMPIIAQKEKKRCTSGRLKEGDKEAMSMMTRERVIWSPQEDSLLLLMKVANIFLGRYASSLLSWKHQRDILHETFPEVSKDKSSAACQRRLNFLVKNYDSRVTVDTYAKQALLDKSLLKEFKQGKVYVATNVKENIVVFKRLLDTLKEKILSGFMAHAKLPDSLKELHETYEIIVGDETFVKKSQHKDITCVNDIYESTLHNVIHACLATTDKNSRSQELFKLFQQYPADMLTTLLSRMVADQILTKKKRNQLKKIRSVHMTAMSAYMLSQRYQYVFLYLSSYPREIFMDSVELLDNLFETHQKTKDDDEDGFFNLRGMDVGGHAAAVVSLFALKKIVTFAKIPEHITVVTKAPAKSKKKESEPATGSKPPLMTESDEEDEQLIEEAEKTGQEDAKAVQSDTDKDLEEFDFDATESENTEKSVIQDSLINATCGTAEKPAEPAGMLDTLSKGAVLGAENRATPYLPCSRHLISVARFARMLNPNESFVVKPCEVKVRLKKNSKGEVEYTSLDPQITKDILTSLSELHPHHTDYDAFLTECRTDHTISQDEVDQIHRLHNRIESAKEMGLTRKEVVEYNPDIRSLDKMLNILMRNKIVTRSGVTIPRYVSYLHVRPWLIHSYKTLRGRSMKPWEHGFADYDKLSPESAAKGVTSVAGLELSTEDTRGTGSTDGGSGIAPGSSSSTPPPAEGSTGTAGGPSTSTEPAKSSTIVPTAPVEHSTGQPRNDAMEVSTESYSADISQTPTPMETETSAELDESVAEIMPDTQDLSKATRRRRNLKTMSLDGGSHSLPVEGTYERVRVLCRPWIKPEGYVNRPTLKMMLEAVLMYIMNNPGIMMKGLVKKFNPILQPMGILELLEMLEKTECITRKLLRKPAQTCLFSSRPFCPIVNEDNGEVVAAYSPTVDCIIKLGQFLSQLQTVSI
ncbi:general transcription factor 3C polypeptide 1-like isoform X2 [Lineus longissimus]|uniref:general transcription factor 3C polypeptide 1-like isoform X2 n=1 Tax=Lineus longissimus TaxID=88925 RepID=UPI00315DCB06